MVTEANCKFALGGWWVGDGVGLNTTMLRNRSLGEDTREYLEIVSQKSDESYVA